VKSNVKICGFSHACSKDKIDKPQSQKCGTLGFMAPELLNK